MLSMSLAAADALALPFASRLPKQWSRGHAATATSSTEPDASMIPEAEVEAIMAELKVREKSTTARARSGFTHSTHLLDRRRVDIRAGEERHQGVEAA